MLDSVRLQRFRSYRDESFEFDPGVNIIVGPNASGKTNLLEALLVSYTGGSFRAKDGELVAFGAPWARLDVLGPGGGRTVKLLVQENGLVKKEFVIGDQKLVRLSLQKSLPVVLFEPNHLLLLHGSPDLRREYMDALLEQTVAGYGKIRRDYRRALAQRNALLKRGASARGQLFAWDIRLSEIGARIASERNALVRRMNGQLGLLYHSMARSRANTVTVTYAASCDITQYSSSLLHALEKRQDVDIERGYTTIGPHREDLVVAFDGREASQVASRGETRTILLALKVMELQFIEEARGTQPILLLDDVFSELDGARRRALTEVISGYQTFITTTDADVVVQHFMNKCRIIPLGG
ncbi:MAG TPA: DNA replication and repair protein RecF [Candidatus Limnocylindria bacterium]|nr:DNA replication and repair protein RecF [Candidatus Limnocylindria bacterium]